MTETTYRVRMPGKFWSFLSGSDVGQGRPDEFTGYVGGRALYDAIMAGKWVSIGKGQSHDLTLTRDALEVLLEYTDVCLDANTDEPDHAEVRAAIVMRDRCRAALAAQ